MRRTPVFAALACLTLPMLAAAQAKQILNGLKSVHVRSFEFDADDTYSKADVDAVRLQLASPGWSKLAQVRDRKTTQDVDVFDGG